MKRRATTTSPFHTRAGAGPRRWLARSLLATATGLGFLWAASSAGASSTVTATVSINGRSVAHSSDSNPIKLDPATPAQVSVSVANNGSIPITVSAVALDGRALDITFFNFETQTALQVQPGTTASQQFSLDLSPLNGQGDGLIPSSVKLLDAKNHVLASESFTGDVRGRMTSLFGLFAIEVTLFTALLFAGALLALSRGKLHENRFRRGLRFLWPGLGLGIVIVFGLAIVRIFVPAPGHWIPVVLICALAGFVVGYLTPNPPEEIYEPPYDETAPTEEVAPAYDPRATLPSAGQ